MAATGAAAGGVATTAAASGSCAGAHDRPSAATLAAAEAATICAINAERRRAGRRALRGSTALTGTAARYSRLMVARRFFAHVTPWGQDLRERLRSFRYVRRKRGWRAGENLAWGTRHLSSPAAIVAAWMRSPPHRANLLRRRWRRLGVGIAVGIPTCRRLGPGATYTLVLGFVDRRRGVRRATTRRR